MIDLLERLAVRHQVAPLSVAGYHRLRDLGLAPIKSELLDGAIVAKMTKSPLHTLVTHRLFARLAAGLPDGYQLRKEDGEYDRAVVAEKRGHRQSHGPLLCHRRPGAGPPNRYG
jgi:hypothetical protein